MKKIFYFIITLLSVYACDSNEPKLFDRTDANVYFPESRVGVTVGNILSIPVTLANLPSGGAVSVGIMVQDSTAKEGEDYILRSGRTCTFEKGHGTAYVVIEALAKETDTIARRILTITLDPVEGFRENSRNQIVVELRNYSRHPLKKILGDAVFKGIDLVRENAGVEFPVNIYPDSEDGMTLYLSGITGGIYGGTLPDLEISVDTLKREMLIMPKTFSNRKLGGVSGDVELVKGTLTGSSVGIEGGVPVRATYDKDGNIFFDDWFGAVWASGSNKEKALFLYYGYYNGQYRTGIMKKQ